MALSVPLDYNSKDIRYWIRDPFYSERRVPIYSYMIPFIDSPEFQRLLDIQQLGVTSSVWPGATYSRYVHSLGVAHLAGETVKGLQARQPELAITERDIACVVLAALCHDLGHGPWSHVWEDMFIKRLPEKNKWRHEEGSEMMFDAIIQNQNIDMPPKDRELTKALIAGDHTRTPGEKAYLFDIVANKTNGLDVDRQVLASVYAKQLDYLPRDAAVTKVGESEFHPEVWSSPMIIQTARVNVQEGHICYEEKEANTIRSVYTSRFNMRTIYNDMKVRAIAYMIGDALLAANDYMKLTEAIHQPERYVGLNDAIMDEIKSSTCPELEEARNIFARIDRSDLYTAVGTRLIDVPDYPRIQSEVTSERVVQTAVLCSKAMSSTEQGKASILSPSDIIVDFSSGSYGMGEQDPMQFVQFYRTDNLNEFYKVTTPTHTIQHFCEYRLVVYVKHAKFAEVVEAAFHSLEQRLFDRKSI